MILQTCDLANLDADTTAKPVGAINRRHRKAITGWQTAIPKALRAALPDDYGFARPTTAEPISVPTGFKVKSSKRIEATPGVMFTEAMIVSEAMPWLPPFVVLNVAYPGKGGDRDAVKAAHMGRLAYWHGKGYTVFWVGDAVGVGRRKMHPAETSLLAVGSQNVRAVVHPDGTQMEAVATGTTDSGLVHTEAHWVRVRLLRKAPTVASK